MANFSPWALGFTFKSSGFSGFETFAGLAFFVLRFRVLHSKFLLFKVFQVTEIEKPAFECAGTQ